MTIKRTLTGFLSTVALATTVVVASPDMAGAGGPTCNGRQATAGVTVQDVGDSVKWTGTNGDDVIIATGGNAVGSQHVILGRGGNDIICMGIGGGAEYGYIHGGYGHDTIIGGRHSDTIIGGPGNDNIRARGGNDWVYGGWGNDWIDGGWGRDHLDGNGGWDVLNGAGGHDKCSNYARYTGCENR